MNRRGQTSIEFILLLVIMMLYIQTVVLPLVENSTRSAEDTTRLAQAELAAQSLANAINYVGSAETSANTYAKQTLHLFVPKDTVVVCNGTDKTIEFVAQFKQGIPTTANELPNVTCNNIPPANSLDDYIECSTKPCCRKTIQLIEGIALDCTKIGVQVWPKQIYYLTPNTFHELSIVKDTEVHAEEFGV